MYISVVNIFSHSELVIGWVRVPGLVMFGAMKFLKASVMGEKCQIFMALILIVTCYELYG